MAFARYAFFSEPVPMSAAIRLEPRLLPVLAELLTPALLPRFVSPTKQKNTKTVVSPVRIHPSAPVQ